MDQSGNSPSNLNEDTTTGNSRSTWFTSSRLLDIPDLDKLLLQLKQRHNRQWHQLMQQLMSLTSNQQLHLDQFRLNPLDHSNPWHLHLAQIQLGQYSPTNCNFKCNSSSFIDRSTTPGTSGKYITRFGNSFRVHECQT